MLKIYFIFKISCFYLTIYIISLMSYQANFSTKDDKTLLYFSDLPLECNEEEIRKFIGQNFSSNLANITFKKPGTAVLIFKDHSVAKEVKYQFNLQKLGSNYIRIMWFENDFRKVAYNSENRNIFVKNIPEEITPRQFFEHFYTFGEIASAKMNLNSHGNHIGYGYINYESSLSAETAIKKCNGKAIFNGYPKYNVEVEFFRMANQRNEHSAYLNYLTNTSTIQYETKSSVFVKNISPSLNEDGIKKLLGVYGNINYFKPNYDVANPKQTSNITPALISVIASFDDENSAKKAESELNNKDINGVKLIVEKLRENTHFGSNQPNKNQYYQFNSQPQPSNNKIFIKNVPNNVTQDELLNVFSKFGKISNCNMYTSNFMQKDKDGQFKSVSSFTGSVQLTFENGDNAEAAILALNGRFLPKHETWKTPLYITVYKSRQERSMEDSRPQKPYNPNPYPYNPNEMYAHNPMTYGYPTPTPIPTQIPPQYGQYGYNPIQQPQTQQIRAPYNQTPYGNPNMGINKIEDSMRNMTIDNRGKQQNQVPQKYPSNFTPIDFNYFNTIIDESQKKDYLGELIFNNISNHPLSAQDNISLDEVGKITGMILGIEDINEVILPCNNYEELTSRIQEALKLLR